MAQSDAAVEAPVEVDKILVYEFYCMKCDQPWEKGQEKCKCGCTKMKNYLVQ